jgi:hypothetical protein
MWEWLISSVRRVGKRPQASGHKTSPRTKVGLEELPPREMLSNGFLDSSFGATIDVTANSRALTLRVATMLDLVPKTTCADRHNVGQEAARDWPGI